MYLIQSTANKELGPVYFVSIEKSEVSSRWHIDPRKAMLFDNLGAAMQYYHNHGLRWHMDDIDFVDRDEVFKNWTRPTPTISFLVSHEEIRIDLEATFPCLGDGGPQVHLTLEKTLGLEDLAYSLGITGDHEFLFNLDSTMLTDLDDEIVIVCYTKDGAIEGTEFVRLSLEDRLLLKKLLNCQLKAHNWPSVEGLLLGELPN